ncbi:MAG: hybrid sensor histidine kinase/response regulator [Planctomycetota bacterium]|nr:hybrid sensor histidine kinase/response regulator [Planctomycetota bacterium]
MDRDELARRLMRSFLGEAEDRIDALNTDLLALEHADPAARDAIVQRLFRAAHSLKGAARAVGIQSVETVSHRMEEVLSGVRDGTRELDPALAGVLFATIDAIQAATGHLQEGAAEDPALVQPMIEQLDAVMAGAEAPSKPATQAAEAPATNGRTPEPPVATPPSSSNGRGGTRLQENGTANGAAKAKNGTPEPAQSAPVASSSSASGSETLRVGTEKLEHLLNESGELMLAHRRVDTGVRKLIGLLDDARGTVHIRREAQDVTTSHDGGLRGLLENLHELAEGLQRDERLLGRVAGRLNRAAQQVRMTSFTAACRGLARAARDVATATGRRAEVHVHGGDVELDRLVVERLRDPLLHLVRNAVSHGIEDPEAREAAGKPPAGEIVLSAALRGDTVVVTVSDDGRGIDHGMLRARAEALGIAVPDEEHALERLVFEPGFSTAAETTSVSGRGVGLDVVKSEVEALRGTIDLHAEPGQGCRFLLTVPLTLTAMHALLVRCGGRAFAIPSAAVGGLVRMHPDEVRDLPTGPAIHFHDRLVPLRRLSDVLGLPASAPTNGGARIPTAIVRGAGADVALAVDELDAECEILIKELGTRLQGLELVSGATTLESGRIALILNTSALVRRVEGHAVLPPVFEEDAEEATPSRQKRLLLADDSVTTRMMVMGILEQAGYHVSAVPDGMAAWESIQQGNFDLVVSDVEMPRMGGCSLTERIRASTTHRELPVILVTGLEKEEHRLRGLAAGANAYVVKSEFDGGSLLEAIRELV